ncbi:MAG: site-2 protease family protein [Nanoarchaeota archaeon]|nr:site-2 protease family protein [Nanoarchaeota archaeon]MBU1028361.1 site-2 protease family protein [Nanoarchaeota archaeon]
MGFIIYDYIVFALLIIFIFVFLYSNRKRLKKEGGAFLYKTKWGMKLIEKIGGKYKKTLYFLSYISITLGYFLMVACFYLVGKIVWLYAFHPQIVKIIKVPPIMPLIPYIDKLVPGLPPFYTTYFILILAVIAITHEFAHGIFMKRYDIKIKSTGFGFFPFFFPVLPLAFVEQDEESMVKQSKFKQMAVLSAGTFANLLTAIFFFIVILIFFSLVFTPTGVVFDDYSYSMLQITGISMVNGISLTNPNYEDISNSLDEEGINEVKVGDTTYFLTKEFLSKQANNIENIYLYDNAPALKSNLDETILEINGIKIDSVNKLGEELLKYAPGQEITITTLNGEEIKDYKIVLEDNPASPGRPWLGIGFVNNGNGGLINKIFSILSSFKKPHVYYEPALDGLCWFIYYLLWWLILICVSVALINMLPVGGLDGGRFLYLTILSLTGREKIAKRTYNYLTYFFLFLIVFLMFFWVWNFFR